MEILDAKRLLITGLLSNRYIASGIAKAGHKHGADLPSNVARVVLKPRMIKGVQQPTNMLGVAFLLVWCKLFAALGLRSTLACKYGLRPRQRFRPGKLRSS